MAVEKVILATKKFSNNWWTLTDNNGREINIGTVNKKTQVAENQKLAAVLIDANAGDEVEIDVRDWQGKLYGNDPKSSGSGGAAKTFAPKNHSREAALYAAQAAGSALALQKDVSIETFKTFAEGVHAWILSKTSL